MINLIKKKLLACTATLEDRLIPNLPHPAVHILAEGGPSFTVINGFSDHPLDPAYPRWQNDDRTPLKVTLKLDYDVCVKRYTVEQRYDANCPLRTPTAWTLSGSTDGQTWSVIDQQSGQFANTQEQGFTLEYTPNDTAYYTYLKLEFAANKGDPYWSVGRIRLYGAGRNVPQNYRTVLLLHGDDGFRDSARYPQTVRLIGTPTLENTATQIGTHAIGLTPGNGLKLLNGIGTDETHTNGINFGAQDFTIDAWVFIDNRAGELETSQAILDGRPATSDTGFFFGIGPRRTFCFLASNVGAASWDFTGLQFSGLLGTGSYNHLEVGRSGNKIYAFVNGVLQRVADLPDGFTIPPIYTPAQIGVSQRADGDFTGFIDELRVTLGVCRHTANFTPQVTPYRAD